MRSRDVSDVQHTIFPGVVKKDEIDGSCHVKSGAINSGRIFFVPRVEELLLELLVMRRSRVSIQVTQVDDFFGSVQKFGNLMHNLRCVHIKHHVGAIRVTHEQSQIRKILNVDRHTNNGYVIKVGISVHNRLVGDRIAGKNTNSESSRCCLGAIEGVVVESVGKEADHIEIVQPSAGRVTLLKSYDIRIQLEKKIKTP